MMKRHRKDLEVISQINITNLLDTAFILLIAFMILAPKLKSGIPLELPRVEASEPLEEQPENYIITILPPDIDSLDDRLLVNGMRVAMPDLRDLMAKAIAVNADLGVELRTDREAKAETLVRVIAICHDVGVVLIQFPTEAMPVQKSDKTP